MAHSHDSGWIRSQSEQHAKEEKVRQWLIHGGGGNEDGEDGLRAATWTSAGLIDVLIAYEEYLIGLNSPKV